MKIYDITGIGANLTGSFSGSFKEIFTGTATTASHVQYSNVANKPTLVSGSTQITYSGISSKPAGIVSGSSQVLAFNVFATTGSNGFNGNQSITGSLTITGQVIAQTLNVQQVTSSIVFSSGSNSFGNNSGNSHSFTGSVNITGSLTTSIAALGTAATTFLTSNSGTIRSRTSAQTLSDIAALPLAGGTLTGNLNGTTATFEQGVNLARTSGNVGIGIDAGTEKLEVFSGSSRSVQKFRTTSNGLTTIYASANATVGYIGNGLGLFSTATELQFGIRSESDLLLGAGGVPRLTIASTGTAIFSNIETTLNFNPQTNLLASYYYLNFGGGSIMYRNNTDIYFGSNSKYNSAGSVAAIYTSANGMGLLTMDGGNLKFQATNTSVTAGTVYGVPIRFAINGDGNVGIGTASPSALLNTFSSSTATQIIVTGADTTNQRLEVTDGTVTNRFGIFGRTNGDAGVLGTQTNHPLIINTNATERMRINSSGVVLINNTYASPYGVLNTFKTPVNSTYVDQIVVQGAGNYPSLRLGTYDQYDGVIATTGNDLRILSGLNVSSEDHNIRFYTGFNGTGGAAENNERMRITSGGYLKASNNGTYAGITGTYHELRSSQTNEAAVYIYNTSASPYGSYHRFSAAAPNNGTNYFMYFDDNSVSPRFAVYSNGGISNYQTYNVNLSDERVKKDIAPLESYWDKFKAIEIVKFKYKDQTHDDYNIGVIAQQVEQVAPEFVDVDGWDTKPKLDEEGNTIVSEEEPLKSIYTADLHHATIKVLQEAMAKIESLEALLQRNNIS